MTAVLVPERIRVGIADDADDLRLLLRIALERDGRFVVVGEAHDGAEAVQMAVEDRIDVLLLDLLMPGTDGFTALERLQEAAPSTRVIVLSGLDDPPVQRRVLDLGAREVAAKSEPIDDVLERIARVARQPAPPTAAPPTVASPASSAPSAPTPDAPAASAAADPSTGSRGRSVLAATLVFVLSASAVMGLTAFWQREAAQDRQERLTAHAERTARAISDEVRSFDEVLMAGAALLQTADVDVAAFRTFTTALDLPTAHPALDAIGYADYVPVDELDAYLAGLRAAGTALDVPAPTDGRGAVVPLRFRGPEEPSLLGTDLAADPVRRAAIEQAVANGETVLTDRVALFAPRPAAEPAGAAHVMYRPVPGADGEGAVRGVVGTSFRVQDLLDALFAATTTDLAIAVHQRGPDTATPVAVLTPPDGVALQALEAREDVELFGQTWDIRVRMTEPRGLGAEQAATLLLIGGLALSLLLGALVLRVGRQKDAALDVIEETRRSLVENRERLRLIARHAPVGMALHDLGGAWIEVNPAMCALLGRSELELRAGSFRDITPPAARVEEEALIARLLAGEIEQYELEQRYLRPDGSAVWASITSTLVRDDQGVPRYRLTLAEDVTDRRSADAALGEARRKLEDRNAQLEHLNDELARSNGELQELAYVASHDLSEPLRVIGGFVELLEEELGGAQGDVAEYLSFIVRNVGRMQALIDDLLRYSRAGTRELQVDDIALDTVVEDVRELLAAQLSERRAELRGVALPDVRGDLTQLRQLLQNLIGNSVKFVPADRVPVVEVTARRSGDRVHVRIEDNGIGIEPRHRQQVFKMFQRLHGREEYEGTGIGLAICRRIVERHGGTIGIEDRHDGEAGTAFTFDLPAAGGDA